jgi:hypothetical protein
LEGGLNRRDDATTGGDDDGGAVVGLVLSVGVEGDDGVRWW